MRKSTFRKVKKAVAAGIIFMILMMTAGCGSEKQAGVDQQKSLKEIFETREEVVIDCFGDSITWGQYSSKELEKKITDGEITPSLDDGGQLFEDYGIYISSVYQSDPTYPEMLEMTLNEDLPKIGFSSHVRCVNDGISGDWLTKDSYKRITCDPDIVIILICGNNFYFEKEYEGTLEATVDSLREKGRILFFATYPLYPGRIHTDDFENANTYLRKVAGTKNVRLIDTYELFEEAVQDQYDRDQLFSTDKIHLSELGYELLGRFIAQEIIADLS